MSTFQDTLMLSVVILILIGLYIAFDGFVGMGIFAVLVFLVGAGLSLRTELPKQRQHQRRNPRRKKRWHHTLDSCRVRIIDLRENG
jgi:hypothetical protein